MLRFQPSKWLSQKVWELCTQKAYSGWQINLTVFNLVPGDSHVIQLAQEDNWEGLSKLFRDGHASPTDCSPLGSLMEVSCFPLTQDQRSKLKVLYRGRLHAYVEV